LPASFPHLSIYSTVNVAFESLLFLLAVVIMLKNKDFLVFFRSHTSNVLLAIPIFTVLLPTFLGYPLTVPAVLILPHLFYLIAFSIAVFLGIFHHPNPPNQPEKPGI
jgi:hypothetical protein